MAVNPDRHLRDLAAERGWPVEDFRRRRRLWLGWWLPAGMAAGVTTAMAAVTGRRLARRKRR